MGTRGTMGVRIDGEDKLCYNHFDSYPDGLGVAVLNDTKFMIGLWGRAKTEVQARKIVLVDEESTPTAKQIDDLKELANLNVGSQTSNDWYCLLRELQGQLQDTLTVGFMIEGNNFIDDSLYCEWGYILNLDEAVLEVYRGFQKEPHNKGRYGKLNQGETNSGHYPCAMIVSFPLDDLPTTKDFIIAINRAGFETDEDVILNRFEQYGEINKQEAKDEYGVDDLAVVIASLNAAGHGIITNDDDAYELA